MCDLLGMCFKLPMNPKYSFGNFRFKDRSNPSGWGIAYYPDNSAQIIKHEVKATSDDMADFLVEKFPVKARIVLSHVRAATNGEPAHRNTHPFNRELNGKEITFAHNGRITRSFPEGRYKPIGETDSEAAFCHILTNFIEDDFEALHRLLIEVNGNDNANFLFSDGRHLMAYADKTCYNKLMYTKREAPFDTIVQNDSGNSVDLSDKDPNQVGYIVSTTVRTGVPTDETWIPFKASQLIVFKDGEIVYNSDSDMETSVDDQQLEEGIEVTEVYQAPSKLGGIDIHDEDEYIGLPKSLRTRLNLETGEKVKVSYGKRSTKATVKKTDNDLINQGSSQSAYPHKHCWLTKSVRETLGLREVRRRDADRFKTVYDKIEISK